MSENFQRRAGVSKPDDDVIAFPDFSHTSLISPVIRVVFVWGEFSRSLATGRKIFAFRLKETLFVRIYAKT